MEVMELEDLFGGVYKNKKILVTGDTGFKGSWLSLWLSLMGAKVAGYSLPPEPSPSHFELLNLSYQKAIGDIRDLTGFSRFVGQTQPHFVFHLAAQPLVRQSYFEPEKTFATNVMGTVNVIEACRAAPSIKAIVVVSSDKCYRNSESAQAHKEQDPLGGHDP